MKSIPQIDVFCSRCRETRVHRHKPRESDDEMNAFECSGCSRPIFRPKPAREESVRHDPWLASWIYESRRKHQPEEPDARYASSAVTEVDEALWLRYQALQRRGLIGPLRRTDSGHLLVGVVKPEAGDGIWVNATPVTTVRRLRQMVEYLEGVK